MSETSPIELVVLPAGIVRSIYDERLDLKSAGRFSICLLYTSDAADE